ncbi:MAG: fused MFS/spermidine synthase [Deltaproteobacteria bacterium]|nr:fused MFS/spermidine synthase [Deltaproteobacteria bacterium]
MWFVALFVGAFLLFQIQPMAARAILPWFGGGMVVWTATVLFFQAVLLVGYGYAFALSRVRAGRVQALIHVGVLVVAVVWMLPLGFDPALKPEAADAPVGRILLVLVRSAGLPCLVLATTAPLLQAWYGQVSEASPYRLYAVSNAGSLLGLLSYPFVVEPMLGLGDQARLWTGAFVVFAAALVACAWTAIRTQWRQESTTSDQPFQIGNAMLWFGLSAFGVVILLATTNAMTTNVAPIPFLWVLPLVLYLLTFIICFGREGAYNRRRWLALYGLSILPALWLRFLSTGPGLSLALAVLGFSLFAGCMVCHGELARLQPHRSRLTGYYLIIAAGGVTGGAFVSWLAPAVFDNLWEHEVGLWGALLLAMVVVGRESARSRRARGMVVVWASAGALLVYLGALPLTTKSYSVFQSRSAYGRLAVDDRDDDGKVYRNLIDGEVLHGSQLRSPKRSLEPTLYYIRSAGIGAAFDFFQQRHESLRIGVVGLGTGTVAGYGRAGDTIRFFELNPEVIAVAKRFFTYVEGSPATVEIVEGDARLSLERESQAGSEPRYRILILDAFTSAAIPVHLLTREAFESYAQRIAADGAIVVNVSSTLVDILPVVRAAARELGFQVALYRAEAGQGARAEWAIVTRNHKLIEAARRHPAHAELESSSELMLWTDDHASLLGALRW